MFPITLSPKAEVQLRRLISKDGRPGVALRVGVKGGGCSGLEYVLKLDEKRRPTDLVLEAEGYSVVCDPKSAVILSGAILDHTSNLIGGGFQFDNPNAGRGCGCGTSFMPKPTAIASPQAADESR